MAMLEVEDGRSVYYEHHRGPRRPVVLVHAWGMNGRLWDRAVSELTGDGHEVVLMDHRGCGRSDKDFGDMSIAAIASDVAALVRRLELNGPVLSGWSIGGPIVVEATAQLGADAAGMVLTVGASPRFTAVADFPEGADPEATDNILAGLATARVDTTRSMAEALCHVQQSEASIAWMHRMFLDNSPRADATLAELAHDLDQRALLPTITVPALVFGGRHDVFVPHAVCERAAQLLPAAKFVSCEGSGHAPPLEEPELYFRELRSFLSTLA